MATEVISMRVPKGTVNRLQMVACEKSLQAGKQIRWTSLLKQAIERVLQEEASEQALGQWAVRRGSQPG
jgi:hypothetical protein